MYSNPLTASSTATQASTHSSTTNSSGGGIDGMFMKLLITQLQNQDPLSPTDPSTFVNQLVGVNSLDQLTQINQLLQTTLGRTNTNAGGQ